MAEWTQPQCEPCWIRDNISLDPLDGRFEVRHPIRANPAEIENCAWCGSLTISGIYVRVDPSTVPFPRGEVDDG